MTTQAQPPLCRLPSPLYLSSLIAHKINRKASTPPPRSLYTLVPCAQRCARWRNLPGVVPVIPPSTQSHLTARARFVRHISQSTVVRHVELVAARGARAAPKAQHWGTIARVRCDTEQKVAQQARMDAVSPVRWAFGQRAPPHVACDDQVLLVVEVKQTEPVERTERRQVHTEPTGRASDRADAHERCGHVALSILERFDESGLVCEA